MIEDKIFLIRNFENLPFKNNKMKQQDGDFIFLSSNYSIDLILKDQMLRSVDRLPPPIIHHRISYSSIFDVKSNENIYTYLEKKGKSVTNYFLLTKLYSLIL